MKYKKALIKIVQDELGSVVNEGDIFSLKTVHVAQGITWIHIEPLKDTPNFPELLTAEVIRDFCEDHTPKKKK